MRKTWPFAVVALLAAIWMLGCGAQSAQEAATRGMGKATEGARSSTPSPSPDRAVPAAAAKESADSDLSLDRAAPADEPASLEMAAPAEPSVAPSRDEIPRRDRQLNRNLQSGTLTAGSFDDIERFADYQEFLSNAMQQDVADILPRWAIGERVMIQVVTPNGEPVADARVTVRPASSQSHPSQAAASSSLLELMTASDGRVMFLAGMDGASRDGEYRVTVSPPQGQAVSHAMHVGQQPWQIVLPDTQPRLPTNLDLALVIDTTGSMGDELEYLKVEIDSIAQAVHEMFPNVRQRYALILYRDEGDQYVTRKFDFTESLAEFQAKLAEQSANGGGDYPEAVHLALEQAGELSWRVADTARVMFLVADAPPHDEHANRTMDAVHLLRRQGVRIYPVASSGVGLKAEFVMRAASFLTLGQYLFLTDHSGVGNPHAKPHVPEYQVERLDRLMIRMITAELSGRRLTPDEVIAIERGETVVPHPVPEEHPHPEQFPSNTTSVSRSRKVSRVAWHGPAWAALEAVPRWVLALALFGAACVLEAAVSRRRAQV